jgi:membrane fusion protein, heavy metal efflux system
VTGELNRTELADRARTRRRQMFGVIGLVAAGCLAVYFVNGHHPSRSAISEPEVSSQSKTGLRLFYPTEAQWTTLTVEPVKSQVFRAEHTTEGKLAVDEDRSTPIFSPYAGRVMKLLAKPGDVVERGQPLFTVEANDMVQAQNDFISASTALNKARSALNLAQIVDKRQRDLFEGKAVPLKEVQNARANLDAAENDVKSNEVALEAARNRLRILGKTDEEIKAFQEKGTIDPQTVIPAPIGGTIVQRKVGPGQYIGSGASDPVFVIGDLSTVWLYAYVRETDAPKVRVGQNATFTVLAFPEQIFEAKISYVGAVLDPTNRRLLVRATIDNPQGLLKPEMFASVSILSGDELQSASVPRDAVIYEGSAARVWVARPDKGIELRTVQVGLSSGRMIQVLDGVMTGEQVVTKGSLFIDRVAAGS